MGIFTDSNNNGSADNQEGISLIQVGGNAGKSSFALAGEYVARGAYAYTLYAFAPGRSAADERAVTGSGNTGTTACKTECSVKMRTPHPRRTQFLSLMTAAM